MKASFVRNALRIALMGALLSFSAPVFGDVIVDPLNQAEDLVHQAWNPGGDPPSNDQRTGLLTQALTLLKATPVEHIKRHRRRAIQNITSALFELKNGDPNNNAVDYIRNADSELRAAVADAT